MMSVSRAGEVDRVVGQNLDRRTRLLGYTHEQLASALNMSDHDVGQVISGQQRLHPSKVYAASIYLGMPIVALFEQPA
jgi:transcriptional regulator with XRE-family HTH domain